MQEERSRLRALATGLARTPRAILWLLASVPFLYVAYLIAANWFLNSDWGKSKLNRKPEKLSMEWQSAWTWWPGVVDVEGLRLEGHNRRADWIARVDDGDVWIWLPSLVVRHVNILRFPGQGAEIAVTLLPPPVAAKPIKNKRGWKISVGRLQLRELRRFKFEPYELTGAGSLHGQVGFQVRESMQFSLSQLAFDNALLTAAGDTAAKGMKLKASADRGVHCWQ